jgi:hypothetical protein
MRGTQLIQLVTMVREEIGRATSVAVGVDDIPGLKQKIRSRQELLYDTYVWPFLRQVFPQKLLQANERYYDFPVGLNLERVESVVVYYSNLPRPIERGITYVEYAIYNPALGATSEPAMKWDVRWTGVKEQFEIWPIPSGNDQQIEFTGIRNLRPLIQDSDVADLDDQLIVLDVASELLQRQGSASAQEVQSRASSRLATLRGRVLGGLRMRRMGMGERDATDQRIPIVVHARVNSP